MSGQAAAIRAPPFIFVRNERFKGGWIVPHYGPPVDGVHAIQMDLACRGCMKNPPASLLPDNWPAPYDIGIAQPMGSVVENILQACPTQVASLNNSNTTKET